MHLPASEPGMQMGDVKFAYALLRPLSAVARLPAEFCI